MALDSCLRLGGHVCTSRSCRGGLLAIVAVIIFTNCFLIIHDNLPALQRVREPLVRYASTGADLFRAPDSAAMGPDIGSSETQMGKIIPGNDVVVLYNAVPKTGSRIFEFLVREFALKRDKNVIPVSFPQNLTKDLNKLEGFLTNLDSGSFVRGHFPYTEVHRSDDATVVYVNSVRDPVERLISNYYYDIYGDGQTYIPRHSNLQYHEKTIDECIEKNGNCFNYVYQYYKRQTFYIFCGDHPSWTQVDRGILERAKKILDKYLVVGEAKEFDNMIAMLQKMLPDYFKDIVSVLVRAKTQRRHQFHTSKKIAPKNTTIAFLREDLRLETEFYEYIRKRFQTLKADLLGK